MIGTVLCAGLMTVSNSYGKKLRSNALAMQKLAVV